MTTRSRRRLIVGLTTRGLALTGALGASSAPVAAAPAPLGSAASPTVIQGQVTAARGMSIVVRTPAQRPSCARGAVCPTFIIAGATFAVDISRAVYESSTGRPIADKPAVGAMIVAVGTPTGARALQASVVERIMVAAVASH